MAGTGTSVEDMRRAIDQSGYYPELVSDALDTARAGEPVTSFLVHHEATFDRDELRRHVTVLALTPSRLLVSHTDENPPDETSQVPYASASTEAVRLEKVDSVVVTRVVSDPARYVRGSALRMGNDMAKGSGLREVVLTIGWGAVSRLDLEPASCADPECEADHGYTGTSSNDDFALRVSEAADGGDVVTQALAFAAALSDATAKHAR